MSARVITAEEADAFLRGRLSPADYETFLRSDPFLERKPRRSNDNLRRPAVAAPTAAPRPSRPKAGAATLRSVRAKAARLHRGAPTARDLKERAARLAPGPDVTVPPCPSASGVRLSAAGARRAAHAIGVREKIVVTWAAAPSLDGGRAAASHFWTGRAHEICVAGDLNREQVSSSCRHELEHAYQLERDPHHVANYHRAPAGYERDAEEVARDFPDFRIAR
jgi:hypothetical protein